MTPEERKELADAVASAVTNAMEETMASRTAICTKEVLNMEEAALYTGLKKSYLYKLTSANMVPFSKPAGKNCFFRRKELEDWMMSNPMATVAECNTAAKVYCMKHKLHY